MIRAICIALAAIVMTQSAEAASGFSDWAAVVVAGDWHAHSGAPSEVFDNARRDIAGQLVGLGFAPANILQFSAQSDRYPIVTRAATPQYIAGGLWDLSSRTASGCFAYFTSHGSPDGIALGEGVLSPDRMAQMVDNACGGRPTVIIVSSCFSGVFVPALQAPERIVITAAAPDRTSFGCGETDKYTYFDSCTLQWLARSGDFPDFAKDVTACVAAREKKENVDLPSEPQVFIGQLAGAIPRWK